MAAVLESLEEAGLKDSVTHVEVAPGEQKGERGVTAVTCIHKQTADRHGCVGVYCVGLISERCMSRWQLCSWVCLLIVFLPPALYACPLLTCFAYLSACAQTPSGGPRALRAAAGLTCSAHPHPSSSGPACSKAQQQTAQGMGMQLGCSMTQMMLTRVLGVQPSGSGVNLRKKLSPLIRIVMTTSRLLLQQLQVLAGSRQQRPVSGSS